MKHLSALNISINEIKKSHSKNAINWLPRIQQEASNPWVKYLRHLRVVSFKNQIIKTQLLQNSNLNKNHNKIK